MRRIVPLLLAALLAPAAARAATVDEATIARHAPVVLLHPGERYLPSDPADFLAHAELRFSRPGSDAVLAPLGTVDPVRLGARCALLPAGCYRHEAFLATDHTRPFDAPPPAGSGGFFLELDDAWRRGERSRPVTFHDVRDTAITYWLFSAYNEQPVLSAARSFAHEGDWERVVVVLDGELRPQAMRFDQHGAGRVVPAAEVCGWRPPGRACAPWSGHPVVFSARGSHASYPGPCTSRLRCGRDLRGRGGRAIETWRALRAVREQPWWGFGGAWGRVGVWKHSTGPLGPSRWKG